MNRGKVTLYDNKLLFRDTGVVFTLKGDSLSMMTEYDFIKRESPDAKQIMNFSAERHFITRATGNSNRDRNLTKNYYNKRAILASGLKTTFLSEDPIELSDGIKLLKQEKRAGNTADMNNQEMVAIFDKLLEYKCVISGQHEKINKNFNLV